MNCAWQDFINFLPIWMREEVDALGKQSLLELRLRLLHKPELICLNRSYYLDRIVTMDDLMFCVNTSSKYSPWTVSSLADGYITAPGGHRIGICGQATMENHKMIGINNITSLCIRISRNIDGISKDLGKIIGSLLIIGKPGSGKTTLLRDVIRSRADYFDNAIGVVDQKCELFPHIRGISCFPTGRHTDILYNCPKPHGIELMLKNMGPSAIAVDEITAPADCKALIHAGWCGVDVLATAHAGCMSDLCARPLYKSIIDSGLFNKIVVMHTDKSWHIERL